MKTKKELSALKVEVEALNKKLAELTEEELKDVTGGIFQPPITDEAPKEEFTVPNLYDGSAGGMQMAPEAKPVEVR